MKKLDLRSSAYKTLLAQFSRHLQTLNYSKDTVYIAPNSVREYLCYLDENELKLLKTTSKDMAVYFEYLAHRSNDRREGGLSINTLHKHRGALKQFYGFLSLTEQYVYAIQFPDLPKAKSFPKVLTLKEVQSLFKGCDDSLKGKRDKAILALYYGCGLRRKEGVMLNCEDIDLSRNEIFIRQSKTRRQRHVPMNDGVQKLIEDYLYNSREILLPQHVNESAFLISNRGKRMYPKTVDYVLKQLKEKTENTAIKEKFTGAHTLRHSIATHLLSAGMKLEDIALFLGHRSLDSTQIYTHLI
jgi:integrase/recombinase XerD